MTEFAAERLERVALDLDALLQSRGHVASTIELGARINVFAGVWRATDANLNVLARVTGSGVVEGGVSWAR